jgi:hypothetical protein
MICAQSDTPLADMLRQHTGPVATATVVSHRMNPDTWNFVLTSDI